MAGIAVRNEIPDVTIEDARIAFRNFSGKEGQYNREGDRNFVVLLDDPKVVEAMIQDGWNIKYLKAREEGEIPQPYVQVSVSYKGRPPKIVMITGRGRTDVPEELVSLFDFADIANVDLIFRPYQWAVSGKTGVKAYLKAIYITIREDELELKYAEVPDSAMSAIGGAQERLQIGSGGRIPMDDDEIVIDDPDAHLPWNKA